MSGNWFLKKWFWFFALPLALCSCKSARPLPMQTVTTVSQKDSTVTRLQEVDSLMRLRMADSVKISALLDQLTAEPLTSTSNGVTASLSRTGNSINCECHTEELWGMIKWQKEIIERFLTKETATVTEPVPLANDRTPWYQKLLTWFGIGILLVFALQVWLNRNRNT